MFLVLWAVSYGQDPGAAAGCFEEPVSLGHTVLGIRAKGEYVQFCIFCISGCCLGWNCGDWKSCWKHRVERTCPLVSLMSCSWGTQQDRSSSAHSWSFFHRQLLTCCFLAMWGGQSKTACSSPDLGDISPGPYLPLPIRLWTQHQLLCCTLALNPLWSPGLPPHTLCMHVPEDQWPGGLLTLWSRGVRSSVARAGAQVLLSRWLHARKMDDARCPMGSPSMASPRRA